MLTLGMQFVKGHFNGLVYKIFTLDKWAFQLITQPTDGLPVLLELRNLKVLYIYVVYVSHTLFLNNQYDGDVGVYTAIYWCGGCIVQKQ